MILFCVRGLDLEKDKIQTFQRTMIQMKQANNYPLEQIGNMDETSMQFDMPPNRTVSKRGEKTIHIKTSGHEKDHFTVVLDCLADGTKLKPMGIFKRKRMLKDVILPGIVHVVHVHPQGWMDEEGMTV